MTSLFGPYIAITDGVDNMKTTNADIRMINIILRRQSEANFEVYSNYVDENPNGIFGTTTLLLQKPKCTSWNKSIY